MPLGQNIKRLKPKPCREYIKLQRKEDLNFNKMIDVLNQNDYRL